MFHLRSLVLAGVLAFAGLVQAQDVTKASAPDAQQLKAAIQAKLGAQAKVSSVSRMPNGWWEVIVGKDVVYTDDKASYLMVGKMYDLRTQTDLTQARRDELLRIDFKALPFDQAMKVVRGKGERVIAVFADPTCRYCKQFEQGLGELDNVTIYTFLYPILSPDASTRAKQIWCSPDRQKAWDDLMLREIAPMARADCANPVDKNADMGRKMEVSGTPTIFFADGNRIAGAVPVDVLEGRFKQLAAVASKTATLPVKK